MDGTNRGNSSNTITLNESDEEWTVEDFTRRVSWTDETAECTNCGSAFELDTTHYYATLRPCQSTSPTEVSREPVFCSQSCADEWLHS